MATSRWREQARTIARTGTMGALFVGLGVACGGGAPGPTHAVTASPAREPSTLEEATLQIRDAERELASLRSARARPDGAPPAPPAAEASPAAPSAPPAKSPATKTEPTADPKAAVGDERTGSFETPSLCERACKALQSMRIAVDTVCRLTGQTDPQCTQAKATLEKNRELAKSKACACSP